MDDLEICRMSALEMADAIKTRKVGRNLCVVGDLTSGAKPGGGLMAPRVGIAAHHQANAVLQIIMGKEAAN